MLKDNIIQIEKRICAACERVGRERSEVTLIAVSKTKPIAMLQEAYQLGMRHFGENKVQELVEKYEVLDNYFQDKVNWHLIGHLQRNKVKYVIEKAVLIHSVDSLRLAIQIEEEAAKKDITCDVLIEVNIAEEDTKYGVAEKELIPLLLGVSKLPHIKIRGLMTIAPFVDIPEKNRKYFKKMRELYVDINTKNIDNMTKEYSLNITEDDLKDISLDILSMGMTGDYEVAIEEGATMVRVGTGIFGERDYTI